MGSLMDDEGVPVMSNLYLTDSSFENPKREKIRVRIRLIDKPAPTEKVIWKSFKRFESLDS